jgi:hypothetical protein
MFQERQERTSFLKKKKQKTFGPAGRDNDVAKARHEQKFFGSFFQK